MKKIIAFLLLLPVLWGCAAQEPDEKETASSENLPAESTSLQQEPDSVETTESTASLKLASDEELIEIVINSKGLYLWCFSSAIPPSSPEGIDYLADICPEFKELLSRDSGLQSLRGYGLQIAEEFMNREDSKDHRVRGLMMQWLLIELFPDLEIDLTK